MKSRTEMGLIYTQTFRQALSGSQCNAFDAENRLISVTGNSQTTQFVYDGDGNLVKKLNTNGSKTLYVGGIYEVDKNSSGTETGTKTYYPAGGAMRITVVAPASNTLYYVLKDHLGSCRA